MILIYKNQTNKVVLTLTENVTLTIPYFLFEFTKDETDAVTYFIAANSSTTKYRYDEFNIVEKTSPDLTDSEVELSPGTYTYKVYEQQYPDNLDVSLAETLLEIGVVRVIGEDEDQVEYTGGTETNITYNG